MTSKQAIAEIKHNVFMNTDDCEIRISKDCYKSLIEALEKQISGGWIPVSERLPKHDQICYVTVKNITGERKLPINMFEATFNTWNNTFDFWGWADNEVVAWIPLPEPYKEEE